MQTVGDVVDVIILGGGPAGSTCARALTRGGARVAVIDREQFPRVKLCGGWVSSPIWDELGLAPAEYSGRLWEWHNCHVRYERQDRAVPCRGFFIRRFELDDFLLPYPLGAASVHNDRLNPVKRFSVVDGLR